MRRFFFALTLIVTPIGAIASEEVTEAFKRDALLRAYKANGNSMTRWGSIDLKDLAEGTKLDPRIIEPWEPGGAVDLAPAKKGNKK